MKGSSCHERRLLPAWPASCRLYLHSILYAQRMAEASKPEKQAMHSMHFTQRILGRQSDSS